MENEEKIIWKNCIVRAIEYLDKNGWENDSRTYDLVYNEKNYPTKPIIAKAFEYIKNENPKIHRPSLGGGKPIKLFLEKLGFAVIEKKMNMIELEKLLRKKFKNIWRCADSSKWHILKNYDLLTFDWLNETIDYKKVDLKKIEHGKKAIPPWVNSLMIGDLIFVMGKNHFNGVAIAESVYDFEGPTIDMGSNGVKPAIKVNYLFKCENPVAHNIITHNNPTTFAGIDNYNFGLKNVLNFLESKLPECIEAIKNHITSEEINKEYEIMMSKISLNQILFGPPGSGKTYNTINRALEIVGVDINEKSRKEIKELFDKKVEENRIVFTTFHQSMSYEDFIEGIKPKVDEDENENKQVIYEVEDGIFKRLVENAKKVRIASNDVVENYSFDDAWDNLVSEVERSLEAKDPLFMSIQTANLGLKVVEISGRGNLKLKPIYSDEAKEYTVSYQRTKKLQEAFPDLSVVKNIDKEFRAVIGGSNSTAYWSVLNFLNDKISKNSKVIKQEKELPALPHVLIIDEINRGNVSAIFGELITLIEDNKRLGNPESLEVILPYSKKKFGVPSNLYIIGTMNTADRSVEALDTALRRRFSFEEMPPNYELTELEYSIFNYPASSILKTINHRIEKLLDKDHAIGHSYFIDKDESTIVESFYKCIIPLLQEYFFGDYGKIGLVLGKGFVKQKEWDKETDSFADFDEYENSSDFEDRNVFEIVDYRNESNNYSIGAVEMTFGKAIKLLMKDKVE